MTAHQPQKIDLSLDYPCPCRRKGRLSLIVLTEALGCDRCQQIFVVQGDGYEIEQLATHYPYKQVWQWTGQHWNRVRSSLRDSYLPLALLVILALLMVWLPLALYRPFHLNLLFLIFLPLLLVLLMALIQWLAYRR